MSTEGTAHRLHHHRHRHLNSAPSCTGSGGGRPAKYKDEQWSGVATPGKCTQCRKTLPVRKKRPGPTGAASLCNACGLRWNRQGEPGAVRDPAQTTVHSFFPKQEEEAEEQME